MKKKIPVVIQMNTSENAAATLAMMLAYFGKNLPLSRVRDACIPSRSGTSPQNLCQAAESFGLTTEHVQMPLDELVSGVINGKISLPVIAGWRRKYYVVIRKIKKGNIFLTDAARGEHVITLDKFEEVYRGFLLPMQPSADFVPEGKAESLFGVVRRRIMGYEKSIIRTALFNGMAILADMALFGLNKRMLDQVISGEMPKYFLPLTVGMGLCVLLNLVFLVLRTFGVYAAGRRMASSSGALMFKKLIHLPLRFFEQTSAGELLERMEKNSKLDYSLMQTMLPRIVNAVQMILYTGMLMFYHPVLAVVCLALEGICIGLVTVVQRRLAVVSRSMTTSSGRLNAATLNGLNMMETIKSTGSENQFFHMWRRGQLSHHQNRRTVMRLNTLISFINGAQSALVSAVLLFGGAFFITKGEFTIGMLSVFQSMWNVVRREMTGCMNMVSTFQTMRTDIERVDDIMARSPKHTHPLNEDEPDKLRGVLSVQDLCFRYNAGDPLTIDHVSFDVQPGQMIALVGSTGCGKSTLVKLIADLYQQESGCILYDGKRRDEISDAAFYASVTVVDQDIIVFRDTVKNNISMWDETIENYEMIMSMRDAHIYDRIFQDPEGQNAMIQENGRNFSGGELQRIELARALCQEPTLLLLDEFTSALDAKTEEAIFNSIRDRGVTCIIVAHRFSTVANCDHVIVLERGKIVEQGSPQQLYQAGGRYYELVSA